MTSRKFYHEIFYFGRNYVSFLLRKFGAIQYCMYGYLSNIIYIIILYAHAAVFENNSIIFEVMPLKLGRCILL